MSKVNRVSTFYKLGKTQPQLEFIDVNIDGDAKLFLDPAAVRKGTDVFATEAIMILDSFFAELVSAVQKKNADRVRQLLDGFHEPNETRLGLSEDEPQGKALGDELVDQLVDALMGNRAVRSGALIGIEDLTAMIDHIAYDRTSDVTTNLLRPVLSKFTVRMAKKYKIASRLETVVGDGPIWDVAKRTWVDSKIKALVPRSDKPLLLVPRGFVRYTMLHDPGIYYRNAVIPFLLDQELKDPNSRVAYTAPSGKNKGERVALKKDVKKLARRRFGNGDKAVNVGATEANPQILARFHERIAEKRVLPISDAELNERIGTPEK